MDITSEKKAFDYHWKSMEYLGNKYLVFYRGYNVWSTWVTNI